MPIVYESYNPACTGCWINDVALTDCPNGKELCIRGEQYKFFVFATTGMVALQLGVAIYGMTVIYCQMRKLEDCNQRYVVAPSGTHNISGGMHTADSSLVQGQLSDFVSADQAARGPGKGIKSQSGCAGLVLRFHGHCDLYYVLCIDRT